MRQALQAGLPRVGPGLHGQPLARQRNTGLPAPQRLLQGARRRFLPHAQNTARRGQASPGQTGNTSPFVNPLVNPVQASRTGSMTLNIPGSMTAIRDTMIDLLRFTSFVFIGWALGMVRFFTLPAWAQPVRQPQFGRIEWLR